jgi:hypothetical protein
MAPLQSSSTEWSRLWKSIYYAVGAPEQRKREEVFRTSFLAKPPQY